MDVVLLLYLLLAAVMWGAIGFISGFCVAAWCSAGSLQRSLDKRDKSMAQEDAETITSLQNKLYACKRAHEIRNKVPNALSQWIDDDAKPNHAASASKEAIAGCDAINARLPADKVVILDDHPFSMRGVTTAELAKMATFGRNHLCMGVESPEDKATRIAAKCNRCGNEPCDKGYGCARLPTVGAETPEEKEARIAAKDALYDAALESDDNDDGGTVCY